MPRLAASKMAHLYLLSLVSGYILTAVSTGQAQPVPPASEAKGWAEAIPESVWQNMNGKSWHTHLACPQRSELSLLHIPYIDFSGAQKTGQLIVSAQVTGEMIEIFAELHKAGFRIASMRLIDDFNGNDDASMNANNTSAFNCRAKTGGTSLSEHAFGAAIDINPVQNPYVTSTRTLPKAGVPFNSKAKRANPKPGMIRPGDAVVQAFAKFGWKWGGDWTSPKDYQHFSKSGH